MEEVVVPGCRPEVETGFEFKPCTEEAFRHGQCELIINVEASEPHERIWAPVFLIIFSFLLIISTQ